MTQSRLPSLEDFAGAEHCVLEDVTVQEPTLVLNETGTQAHDVAEEVAIADKLRGRTTSLVLYREGWADIETTVRKKTSFSRIDLHFLDATPESSRHVPMRLLKIFAGSAAGTAVCSIPAWFGWLMPWSMSVTLVVLTATAIIGCAAFYRTQERIVFKTLHGRAEAIRLVAGLGTIRQYRKLVPQLSEAIVHAAVANSDETSIYLRAEMREHYRLREDGILTDIECAESTSRVLNRFNDPA